MTDGTRTRTSGIPLSKEEFVDALTAEIEHLGLQHGDRLPSERVLADRFGVSRPVVREALQRLQERGLIHVAPGSGAYLREVSALDWARPLDAAGLGRTATPRELVEARGMLEEQAAALAAERATPEDIDNMERALASFADAGNVIDRARSDIAFHSLLARASHNPVIEMMYGAIAPLVFEVMLRSLDDARVTRKGAPWHEVALEAIKKGDGPAAAAAMREHVGIASDLYGKDLDRPISSIARRKIDSLLGRHVALEDVVADALGRSRR
jgi:GntR family transcriptional repressor for pyruvate dehydrogenase complex